MSSDTATSRSFYGTLFGWEALDANPDFGGYFNYTKNGVLVAGCVANNPEYNTPDMWSTYIAVDDAAATVAAAEAAGAQVHVPTTPIADLGSMAMVGDPGQASIGIWQPGAHKGFGTTNEHGTPSWFELHTRDYDSCVAFYSNVFGWDTHQLSDEPDFRYTTNAAEESATAGIMDSSAFMPEGVPSSWAVYFWVDDVDAAVSSAVAMGATVQHDAEDSPYGRLAGLADPTGAAFKLRGPNLAS